MATPPKTRQPLQLDEVPADLSTPISRSLAGAAAVEAERLRRFQVALDYLGIQDPGTPLHRARLFVTLDRAFPNAFRVPDKRGPKSAGARQSLALFRWVADKQKQSNPPKTAAAIISGALLGINGKKKLLARFPWLKGKKGGLLLEGSILNRVSRGKQFAKEVEKWEAERRARMLAFPQPAKKVSHN